ncbi:MAG: GGDEF domain-containing protein [Frankiaceae bacterium]|nr:GGDEF domain-containing protein [Frankiaceae bacterium]
MRGQPLTRHLVLPVSIALVLVLGLAGLWAGREVGAQAEATHRADRLALQMTLGGLSGQYVQVSAAEVLDIVGAQARAGAPAWAGTVGSTTDAARLRNSAVGSRAMSAGAVLVGAGGVPLNSYAPPGRALPSPTDPGWAPLRAAVLRGNGTVPVSDVLHAGPHPVSAVAVPVTTATGATVLLVGLTDLRTSALQKYVEHLVNPDGRRGYLLDSVGVVIAGPTSAEVGTSLRHRNILRAVTARAQGVTDVRENGTAYTESHARAGATGWTSVTIQDSDRFLGPLRSASRRAQSALVLLLLTTGTALLMLHRRREAALRDVALTDELTGLYNRRGWLAVGSHEIERALRGGERRGLLFVDIDGLKQVNDALGHREGDRAISAAADVLRSCARSSDVLGRLGGDEFVLLLGEDGTPGAVRQRVLDALAVHNAGSGARFDLRLSIGAEVWTPDSTLSLDELVRRADRKMYADKTARPTRHDGVIRIPEPLDGRAIDRIDVPR